MEASIQMQVLWGCHWRARYLAVKESFLQQHLWPHLILEVCQMVLKDSFYPLEISSCGRSFLFF